MDSFQCVEFYIMSNPPLQPNGVRQVMEWIKEWNVDNLMLEVLYEPEMPWFKVLAFEQWKDEVSAAMESFLSRATGVCSVTDVPRGEASSGIPFDVVPTSDIIPWAALSICADGYMNSFDEYKYPGSMQPLRFKKTWNVDAPGYTIQSLFRFPITWHDLGFPNSLEALQKLIGCSDISHNLSGTKLYLGSNDNEGVINRARHILHNLLQTTIIFSNQKRQLIYVENEVKVKYVFKYLSHLGLLKTTYPPRNSKCERQQVRAAVSIRTATPDMMVNNRVSYVATYGSTRSRCADVTIAKSYSAFNNYKPRHKEAKSISSLLKKAEKILSNGQKAEQLSSRSTSPSSSELPTLSPPDTGHSTQELTQTLELEDLIVFDEGVNYTSKQSAGLQVQESLLDDNPPFELQAPSSPAPSFFHTTTSVLKLVQHDHLPSDRPMANSGRRLPTREADIHNLLAESTKSLVSLLQFIPGHVSVRLKFGRLYLTNLGAAEVDVGNGPYWTKTKLIDNLETPISSENLRFCAILSVFGADADALVGTSTQLWTAPTIHVVYQIECSFKGEAFFVEIDADTFEYTCRGADLEISSISIHCPRQAWDMKVCADSSKNLNTSAIHRTFGKMITRSLHIFSNSNSATILGLMDNKKSGVDIEGVTVRYIAQHSHANTKDSILSIIHAQKLLPDGDARQNRREWRWPVGQSSGPNPTAWYEAYLSSCKIDSLLKENSHLSAGNTSAWNAQDIEAMDLFSLYGPAIKMIPNMDPIGQRNDNGLNEADKLVYGDAVAEDKARNGDVVFW